MMMLNRNLCKTASRSFMKQTRAFSVQVENELSYSEKQDKKGRPVSPHVSIYAFPPTALSSITHRVTGSALFVGITGVGGLALVGVDVPSLMQYIGNITLLGNVAKFSVAFPFVYHYISGCRHMMWDNNPHMLDTESVTKTSYAVFGSAAAVSAGLALVSCSC